MAKNTKINVCGSNSPKLGLIFSLIHTNHRATFSTVPAIPLEIRWKTSVYVIYQLGWWEALARSIEIHAP